MASDRPNVLVPFGDRHSYRRVGHCDDGTGEPVTTPTLDRLAGHPLRAGLLSDAAVYASGRVR